MSGFPPSFIPALQNIGILHHKKEKLRILLQQSVIEMDEQKLSQLNFTRLTLASFELEVIEEWIDPFDSTTLRWEISGF